MYCLQDPQIWNSTKKKIFKTGSHDTIHTYKIILLQSFQFLSISSIQIDPNGLFG